MTTTGIIMLEKTAYIMETDKNMQQTKIIIISLILQEVLSLSKSDKAAYNYKVKAFFFKYQFLKPNYFLIFSEGTITSLKALYGFCINFPHQMCKVYLFTSIRAL